MPSRIERPSVLAVLRSSSLLNGLTEDQLHELAGASKGVEVARGDYIWLEGAEVDFFGVVGSGFVKMVRSSAEGHDATLELMGPGQVFGLLGTLEGKGCPLTAVAGTAGFYVRVPKRVFMPMYRDNIPMKDLLLRRTTRRFQTAHDLMAKLATGTVEQRIATILFVLCESYGERTPRGVRLGVPLTRHEIGEMVGTTVESTIRTMSKWQKDGVVATEDHHITILDEEHLKNVLNGTA